jgi:hypothetical protein
MYKVSKYPQGTFSWADCTSTDAAKAIPFYHAVMGWSSRDEPIPGGGVYTMFQCDGETVAAISQMSPEQASNGMPSVWLNYVTVDDVDAMAAKIPALGGTLTLPPMDVMDEGRMLLLQDPGGAQLALWQPKNHIGASVVNKPGAMSWNELATRDLDTVKTFYGELLGWEFQKVPDMAYHTITNNGRMNGGMIEMTDEWAGMPSHWMVYFSVEDCDAAVQKAEADGGKVGVPPTDIPAGRFAVLSDPAGAHFTIMKASRVDPWEE